MRKISKNRWAADEFSRCTAIDTRRKCGNWMILAGLEYSIYLVIANCDRREISLPQESNLASLGIQGRAFKIFASINIVRRF